MSEDRLWCVHQYAFGGLLSQAPIILFAGYVAGDQGTVIGSACLALVLTAVGLWTLTTLSPRRRHGDGDGPDDGGGDGPALPEPPLPPVGEAVTDASIHA